jgi:CRP/FNR family cyclic AMP-dependent transcriptional regulator
VAALETSLHFSAHRECRVLTESVLQHLPDAPTSGASRKVKRGDLIYAMGDPTGHVYFLRSGRVALSMVSEGGKEQRLRTAEAGEIFGELCFCDIRARQEQARMLTDGEVVSLVVDDLLSAILQSPEGTAAMLGTMCARVSEAEQQVQRMAFHTVPERIGLLLISLPADSELEDGGRVVAAPPTHEEIAQSVGASRELVSSTLSGFRRLGLVRYRRGSALIVFPGPLAAHLGLDSTTES